MRMSGLQNLKTKKMRIFKFDDRAEIKNFYFFYEKAILVMGELLTQAFTISFDGEKRNNMTIEAPRRLYLEWAAHALVKNELFIFGGRDDQQNIAKLEGCIWTEQSSRLINRFSWGSAALSIEDGTKALICFNNYDYNRCEIFGGEDSTETYSSKYSHVGGKLGSYQGNPTTVGGTDRDGKNKVETMGSSGWTILRDFPKNIIRSHVLLGLPSGSLLLAGGTDWAKRKKTIWLLENDIWRKIGDLQYAFASASAIMIGNSIFIVPGWINSYKIERLDFAGDRLISQRIIENNVDMNEMPVLFEVPANYCA